MLGVVSSQRAISTFCWLPPERFWTARADSGVLTRSAGASLGRRRVSSAARRRSRRGTELRRQHGDLHVLEHASSTKHAGVLPVLGQEAMPFAMAVGRRIDAGWLAVDRRSRPTSPVVTPKMRLGNLACAPSPTRPATPRISPARTSKETSRKHARRGSGRDRQHDLADRHVFLREHLRELAADHHADQCRRVSSSRSGRADIRGRRGRR